MNANELLKQNQRANELIKGYRAFESEGIPDIDFKNKDGLSVFATFHVIDLITVKACGHKFGFISGFYAKEEAEVQNLFDEDGFSALEKNGWRKIAIKTWFYGPLVLRALSIKPETVSPEYLGAL